MRMKIVGHRGARGLAPENTLASIQKAIEHGVDEVEFDVRLTQDNIVILHHNPFLTDPNGEKRIISHCDYAELKQHKPDLTTLTEVLDTIGHPVPLQIEVKPAESTKPVIAIIQKYLDAGWQPEHFLLASFNQETLLELHIALPEIQKVVIESWSGWRATHRATQLNTKRISMNAWWLWIPFIQPIAKRGWELHAYRLNDPVKAKRWARYGLAGVITDFPERFEK